MNKLISCATFFEKSNHNTWSWAGNLENPKQLDHIVTRQSERKKIIDCYTTELSGVDSDHHALTTTVRIAKFIPKKGTTKNQPPDEHILDEKPREPNKIGLEYVEMHSMKQSPKESKQTPQPHRTLAPYPKYFNPHA